MIYLKNIKSGKYRTLSLHLFYQYQFLQKRQFNHNIAFMYYTKTSLLSLFFDSSYEPFTKNTYLF